MNYFLAICIATICGCLAGIFGTMVYYSFYADEPNNDYWDDDEDLWK